MTANQHPRSSHKHWDQIAQDAGAENKDWDVNGYYRVAKTDKGAAIYPKRDNITTQHQHSIAYAFRFIGIPLSVLGGIVVGLSVYFRFIIT